MHDITIIKLKEVSTALGKLGIKPILIGCVGNDLYGNDLLSKLEHNNVDINNIVKVDKPTGVACITLYNKDNRIILNSGANYEVKHEDINRVFSTLDKDDIFLTQYENNFDAVEYAISLAKELGLYTVLNPAPFMKTNLSIYNGLDILILNETECASLVEFELDSESTIEKAINYIISLNVKNVIITLGEKGSILYSNNKITRIKAYKTQVIDSTCAGDSYIGALLSKIAQGSNFIEAADFASKIASLTVAVEGAQNSIPTLKSL